MRREGISSILVVDENRRLQGYVTADNASDARKKEITDIKEILQTDILRVTPDTPMQDIFSMIYDTPVPIAVVEDNGRLNGIIVRGAVLAALANDGEVNLNA